MLIFHNKDLVAFGELPKWAPKVDSACFSRSQDAAAVASSTNQADKPFDTSISVSMGGTMASASIAMPSGSPCVVPSFERISPPPDTSNRIGDW